MSPEPERFERVGEIELCWQQFGGDGAAPMLLIMGLGSQMILWPDGFCELLAGRGFRVIRFDNRDCGRSTVLDDAGSPSLQAALGGDVSMAPYTLSEMAGDAAGLLEALGIERAHLVGASLGGMIAQTLAVEHPARVLSLASIMSTTGDRAVGLPSAKGIQALTTTPPADRDGYVETLTRARDLIGSPGFAADERYTREVLGRSFDRGYHPAGTLRQTVAIVASGDRTPALHGLDLPAIVVHGDADELIAASGGEATAAAIPGARLLIIRGMGHDLPEGAWETIVDAVMENAERVATGAED